MPKPLRLLKFSIVALSSLTLDTKNDTTLHKIAMVTLSHLSDDDTSMPAVFDTLIETRKPSTIYTDLLEIPEKGYPRSDEHRRLCASCLSP